MFEVFVAKQISVGFEYDFNLYLFTLSFMCVVLAINFKEEFGFNFINGFKR